MRDALSLLDQAIAHGAGKVDAEGVRDMLGAVDRTYVLRLLEAVAAGEARQILAIADELQLRSLSFDSALQDLASMLLQLALAHAVPDATDEALPEHERLAALGRRFDAEQVQLCYQIALQGRADLALAPDEHSGFVMTLLRMLAFRPESPGTNATGKDDRSAAPALPAVGPQASQVEFDGDWPALAGRLPVTGAARELARNSVLVRHAPGAIELMVPKSMSHLADRGYLEKLKSALEAYWRRSLALKVQVGETGAATAAGLEAAEREARRAEAARAVQGDRFVQDLVDIFDAKVVNSGVKANGRQG
jgi:DNA polymerase III subunit gamma/tau